MTLSLKSEKHSMTEDGDDVCTERVCPACGGDASYRYGRTKHGKQRYLCLLCNRQFIVDRERMSAQFTPLCPTCGAKMHLYKREGILLRFRCSQYPVCRTYSKCSLQDVAARV